jgi:hypothetical protein
VDQVDPPRANQLRRRRPEASRERRVVEGAVEDAAVREPTSGPVADGHDLSRKIARASRGTRQQDRLDSERREVFREVEHRPLEAARIVERVRGPREQRDPHASLA